MTPSRVRKVLTISFLISVVLSIGSRLESSPRQEETPQRRETHRKRVPDESGRGFAEPGDGLLDAFVEGEDRRDTSELQSPCNLVCRLLLEKKKTNFEDC